MNTEIVDMGQLIENIKSYEDPIEYGIGRFEQEHQYLSDELTRLVREMVKRGVDREKCVFLMNPSVKLRLIDELANTQMDNSALLSEDRSHTYEGRPIRTHPDIPESVALFMAPNSVGLSGKVYNPRPIVYVELMGDTDE